MLVKTISALAAANLVQSAELRDHYEFVPKDLLPRYKYPKNT